MNLSYLNRSPNSKFSKSESDFERLKFVVIGDYAIGKSTLLYTYTNNEYPPSDIQIPTIGVDFYLKEIKMNNKRIKIQLWDTSGQEKFMAITRTYFRDKDIILLLYDMSRISTFNSLTVWIEEIRNNCKKNNNIYMIGTKKDKQIQGISQKAKEFAKEQKFKYYEISVKMEQGKNKINDIFEDIIKNFYEINNHKTNLNTNFEKISISENYEILDNNELTNCCILQ